MIQVIFSLICLIALVSYAIYRGQQGYVGESLRGASGRVYPYRIGDHLPYFYGGTFSGIDIALPATLPNIFLDGRVDEGNIGPRRFYDSAQTLKLEGNFNEYFTLYVSTGYQVLALSIMTPDVMETLMQEVPDCDVEFYKDHMRIIVRHKLGKRPTECAALVRACEAVLQEVDGKLRSWSEADSQEARTALLRSEDNPTLKLFGKPFRASTPLIGLFFGFYCLLAWPAWLIILIGRDNNWPRTTPPLSWWIHNWWPPFLVFPVLWLFLIFGLPRDWPKRIWQKLSHKNEM